MKRLPLLAALAGVIASCGGDGPVDFTISFEDEATGLDATVVIVLVNEGTCADPGEVAYSTSVNRDSPGDQPMPLPPGTYAVSATARDTTCQDIATTCVDVTAPRDEALILTLTTITPTERCAPSRCDNGICTCAEGEVRCGAICQAVLRDPLNCGACGNACAAGMFCIDGTCSIGCDAPRAICDEAGAMVCVDLQTEAAHCGTCGMTCDAPNVVPECTGGVCGMTCETGFEDCNLDPADGCEVDTDTDVANCGGCGDARSVANGTGACVAGSCEIGTCDALFGDCNADSSDGCEESLDVSDRCGSCDRSCGTGAECLGGRCDFEVVDVGLGCEHTCAATVGGDVMCWGSNLRGQLSRPRIGNEEPQGFRVGVEGARQVAATFAATCARQDDGGVCWGSGSNGQLGFGGTFGEFVSDTPPVSVLMLDDAVDISGGFAVANCSMFGCAGSNHFCALRTSGVAACWGGNFSGQLGNGMAGIQSAPFDVPALSDVVDVAAGGAHTCAALTDGTVSCWGDSSYFQHATASNAPIVMAGLDGITQLDAANHTCAVRGDEVLCWGANASEQLGRSTVEIGSPDPMAVPLPAGIGEPIGLAAGGRQTEGFTCGLFRTEPSSPAVAYCWGKNAQLELGRTLGDAAPAPVDPPLDDPIAIDAGCEHACAVERSGELRCWGDGRDGQLATGNLLTSAAKEPAFGLRGVHRVEASRNGTCALRSNGAVVCWGPVPMVVPGIDDAIDLAVGPKHTCALRNGGGVSCWGENDSGALGNGSVIDSATPVDVVLGPVSHLSTGGTFTGVVQEHSCAVSNGELYCWGSDATSQLAGTGTEDCGGFSCATTPQRITSGTMTDNVRDVAAGTGFTCAIVGGVLGGSVWCWGSNSQGQLGRSPVGGESATPEQVGLNGIVQLALGDGHACARRRASEIYCWGDNVSGQIGDGTMVDQATPVEVLTGALSVHVGQRHTCAVRSAGGLSCWGHNGGGQAAPGAGPRQLTPLAVPGLLGVVWAGLGQNHTCALDRTGQPRCFGGNGFGQLGDGTRVTPAGVVSTLDIVDTRP